MHRDDLPVGMTIQRLRVLQYVASHDEFPNIQAIARHMQWKTCAGVHIALASLRGMDLVDRHPYKMGRHTIWFVTKAGRAMAMQREGSS